MSLRLQEVCIFLLVNIFSENGLWNTFYETWRRDVWWCGGIVGYRSIFRLPKPTSNAPVSIVFYITICCVIPKPSLVESITILIADYFELGVMRYTATTELKIIFSDILLTILKPNIFSCDRFILWELFSEEPAILIKYWYEIEYFACKNSEPIR